jgi:hypothetical protein
MLDRNHQCRAQLLLILFEAREGLIEQLSDTTAAIAGTAAPVAHGAQAVAHHRRHQRASRRKVAIGRRARNSRLHRDLRNHGTGPDCAIPIACSSSSLYVRAGGRPVAAWRDGLHGELDQRKWSSYDTFVSA